MPNQPLRLDQGHGKAHRLRMDLHAARATCRLGVRELEEEAAWIERHRKLWDARFDQLDKVVEELKRKEKADGRRKRD